MPARALLPTLDEAPRPPEWVLHRGPVVVCRESGQCSESPEMLAEIEMANCSREMAEKERRIAAFQARVRRRVAAIEQLKTETLSRTMDAAGVRDEDTVNNVMFGSGDTGTPRVYRNAEDEANLTLRPMPPLGEGDESTGAAAGRRRLADHIREALRIAQLAREQLLSRSGRSFMSAAADASDDGEDDDGDGGWSGESATNRDGGGGSAVQVVGPMDDSDDAEEVDDSDSSYELTFDESDAADFPLLVASTPPRHDALHREDGGGTNGASVAAVGGVDVDGVGSEDDTVVQRHGELVMRTALGPRAEQDERRRVAAALALRRKLFSDTERLRARVFAQQREHSMGTQPLKERKEAERRVAEAELKAVMSKGDSDDDDMTLAEARQILLAEIEADARAVARERAAQELERRRFERALRWYRRQRERGLATHTL